MNTSELIKEIVHTPTKALETYQEQELSKIASYITKELARAICHGMATRQNEIIDTILQQQTGWIPCSERLPEDESYVLVSEDGDDVYIAYFDLEKYDWYYTTYEGNCHKVKVDAWMPLPEPYKAGDK